MLKKEIFNNRWVHYAVIVITLAIAIFGAITIKKFIGYAGVQVPAEAGTITSVLIDDRQDSAHWGGIFGLVFSQSGFNETQSASVTSGTISAVTLVFDCMDQNKAVNEMYASTNSTIDFSNIRAGNTNMIDIDFLNLSNDTRDRANNTFTYN